MTDKQRIKDLEDRVRDLEARPQLPAIIVLPAPAPVTVPPGWAYPPWYPAPSLPWEQWKITCGSPAAGNYLSFSDIVSVAGIH